ncbi:Protein FAR1-RELATED SEQUENCE 5 [Striga hermonthica]|uniref:Protein FAR1-RELATED SEQUENCE n=1 Tax=Striga hermonthica TaxID=68872 RepID=A0A9N7N4U9_STRHE|nr:Protein FAR1-RELATED SEQUENCE 5 [Striga hermonthica]
MDIDSIAGLRNNSQSDIKEKSDPTSLVDADINYIGEASNFPNDAEVTVVHENGSLDQEANEDGMDVDSESTYSCLNSSSEEKSIGSDAEHEFTSHYGSSIEHNGLTNDSGHENLSSSTCNGENNGLDVEVNQRETDAHASTSGEPSNASPESVRVIAEEDGEYIVPKLGVEFESEAHAYKCYNKYALMEGFSIRKDFMNRSKVTGFVVSRRYTCHRQGHGSIKREATVSRARKETRTGCMAHMTITRQSNGKYRVIHLETRHNHEFVTALTAHLLPSQKRISFVQAVEANSGSSNPVPDGVPKLGMGFESEDLAYEFYNAYAGRLGFSVRKDYVNRSKRDGAVASRRYTCFREGFRQNDKRGSKVKRPRKETRVGCMAQLVISRQVDGKYRVTHFEESHNHVLVPLCKVRMLRSQKRSVGNNQLPELHPKSLNELLLRGVRDDFICDSVDREMNLMYRCDWNMKQEEAENLHHYFQSKKLKDPSFVYAIQLDVEEEMTNFFWADEKMMADYADFGDVVCLDTACLQDELFRPLVLFLGINNHKQILVFGAAFLYDNTAQSFKWLLRTFLKGTSGKIPKTILSGKEAVISEAINSELPQAQHRLCTCQTYHNALKHLDEVASSSDSFSSDLRGCFLNPDEEGFLNSWKVMLDTYGLWESEWLLGVFEERERWALAFSKHIFSADLETALLSEGSITSLKKYLKPQSHVLQFVKHFGRVVTDWRYKELEANYDMGQQTPRLMGDVIMLKQVREVYTPVIFYEFHQEYENCLNIVINDCNENTSSVEYKVSTYGQVRQYTVLCSLEDDSVACSCMKFESVGILCSHALKVLDYKNIKIVPSRYILKRWTRDAQT